MGGGSAVWLWVREGLGGGTEEGRGGRCWMGADWLEGMPPGLQVCRSNEPTKTKTKKIGDLAFTQGHFLVHLSQHKPT